MSKLDERPRYTIAQAARYVQISPTTLRSWVVGRPYQTASGGRYSHPLINRPFAEDAPVEKRRNGAKPAAKKGTPPARSRRRTPQPPSWQRAGRRALILGAVVFVLFGMLNKTHNYAGAAVAAVIYTALFIPFTYTLDRFAYRRWQARDQASTTKR